MISFREPQLSDKPQADQILRNQAERTCDYSFGNIYIWRHFYQTTIAFQNGFLLIHSTFRGRPCYIYPAGGDDKRRAVRLLLDDAKERGEKFLFSGVTPGMKDELEALFPGKFVFTPVRDYYDYIYRAADLIALPGRKYHGKRNHIVRFQRLGDWRYEPVDETNLAECDAMNDEWCQKNGGCVEEGKRAEFCAIKQTFRHYAELGFKGGLLRLDGRVVAFSIGEQLNADTFVTHFEKAFDDIEGAYPAVNREFADHFCSHYEYVNREEDLGLEGLRRAKLSYQPAILLEKSLAELNE